MALTKNYIDNCTCIRCIITIRGKGYLAPFFLWHYNDTTLETGILFIFYYDMLQCRYWKVDYEN